MITYKLNAYVGNNGILKLEVPVELKDMALEVLVVVNPLQEAQHFEKEEWIKRTYGALRDVAIEIDYEGDFEERDPIE
ncbi:MAG: hypothetical protein HXY40_04155 [Chloroflexi bacterium]|nr:hypothetical protein [Chloroflexota bacterium]